MNVIAMRYLPKKHNTSGGDWAKDLLNAVRENGPMVSLAALFLAGIAAGSLYARNVDYEALKQLDFLFAGNFKARMTQSVLSVFAASFASSFVFILACFLCGLSMWGAFLIPAVDIFRGFGLGLTSGYLYSSYGWKGFLYNLAVILPGAFVCSIAILAASLEGIRCSRMLACRHVPDRQDPEKTMGAYVLHFGAALAWCCAAALLDTAFSALWGGYFQFS